MTAEEAINVLMSLKRSVEIYVKSVPEHTLKQVPTIANFAKACDVAIVSLEKQIAKKPDFEGDGYDCSGNLVYDTWICPNCEADYEVDYEEYECCPKCGQAIDWSEE